MIIRWDRAVLLVSVCAVLHYAVLSVPFPFCDCVGQDVEFDCISF